MPFGAIRLVLVLLLAAWCASAMAQLRVAGTARAKIIIDTDVGDDVDDAFAIDLALASPEFQILGISTAWGDTAMRAQMVDRMLCETGRTEIEVNAGIVTRATSAFSQVAWARAGITHRHGDAVGFLLDQTK